MATSQSKTPLSRRAGRAAARTWRWLLVRNGQFTGWLIGAGAPTSVAKAVSVCALLLVVGVLLYGAFWLGMLVIVVIAALWLICRVDLRDHEQEPRWRDGVAGFGLYRGEVRIDPGEEDDA
ncbi:DUF3742 family protein [Acidovorax sp. NCPPB 3859]|nr:MULTISPECIES: DUF3742 family protein [unclassified Acidovorax]MDA8448953.1 DUF3742 family protein [Acidovorax sp. GBBC 3297]MDA8458959.1 DUF3742 family protein [Acidovorax sp. GBBC 3333]MDA8463709.1 DUF3742 family protein [Acidovorax sp. GBBC 3332]MDA8468741.1 DUF3742 family protein [Acidovorax sp. GBBC 3299]WCM80354.1 DUF3742 family protein [Acidovorax sp. GBBC 712]